MSHYKKPILKSVIIGAGKIGCFYDRPTDTDRCSTHAHAYYNSKQISLEGIFDTDKRKAFKAAGIWGARSYDNLQEMLSKIRPNIVSITVPTKYHYQVFLKVLRYQPDLIFIEKPLTDKLENSVKIVRLAEKKAVRLAVNYQRQWMKDVIGIQRKYKDGIFGRFISGVVYYNKGIYNNGAHFLHLMISLLGDVVDAKVLGRRIDYTKEDPTVDACVEFKNGRVYFIGLDNRYYSIGEVKLFFEKARIDILDFGRVIVRYGIRHDRYYRQEKILKPLKTTKTSLSLLGGVVENLAECLRNNSKPAVDGRDALMTERALAMIGKRR